MKVRWWYLALFVIVGVGQRLSESRQGRGILLVAGLVALLGAAIAWLTGGGPRIRSTDRDVSQDTPVDDHMLP